MWCLLQVIGTTYRITTDSLDSTTFRMGSKLWTLLWGFEIPPPVSKISEKISPDRPT
jgi:hypothetical protein